MDILELKSANSALSARIQELEAENARLSARLQLNETEKAHQSRVAEDKRRGNRIANPRSRFVALKMMYLGSRYYGFASQGSKNRTVESEFFAALEKSNLLVGSISESQYSRCGRTDRGVSATYQVVALCLRSIAKIERADSGCQDFIGVDRVQAARESQDNEEVYSSQTEEVEIDYVTVLNRALPDDIRILGWCPVPPGFNARFSCLYREYRYFFMDNGLHIDAMKEACRKLVGEYDFRNFCKMDAQNVHNYRRTILDFDILPTDDSWAGEQLWVMQIRGHAFLWHQVRCMAAVLFMVGNGHEQPSIVDELLDITRVPRKPQYVMASEVPLVLRACAYQGLRFRCKPETKRLVQRHLQKLLHETLLSAAVISEGIDGLDTSERSQHFTKHIPLLRRSTEPTYNERRAKLASEIAAGATTGTQS